ncbi:porin [Cereibacter johrii]|uniref:porin n=1 Tax=Cereibacter johrii TaxID=445629 RepID=UPI002B2603D5|nr:porin [Cereibacter johrii]MEA5160504.1 porin [Cereibacter johrii]
MTPRYLVISTILASALPLPLLAQTFDGAVTLGYGQTNVSDTDTDVTTLSLDGRFGLDMGNGLRFGLDLATASLDDGDDDMTRSFAGVTGSYGFQNGASLGVYGEQARLDLDGFGDATMKSYGLTAGYEAEGALVTGFYGESDIDDLPSGIDLTDFGASFRYSGFANGLVGLNLQRTTLSADGLEDVDLDVLGVAGSYDLQAGWTLFGGLAGASLDVIDADLTTLGVGVSYDLSQATQANAAVSLELVRSELDVMGLDADATTVRLGLSIPLGGRSASVPLGSVADTVLNPRHSALSSTLFSAF